MLHHAENNGIDPVSGGMAKDICALLRKCILIQNSGPDSIIYIVIYIGNLISYSDNLTFQCRRIKACLMISNTVTDFPCQVQSLAVFLYSFYNSDTLFIMTEEPSTAGCKSSLSHMTKRCMPYIMAQRDCFRQILICPDGLCNRSCQLCNFQGMCKTCSVMISIRSQKYLRLMFHPSKRLGVDDLVSVPLIGRSYITFRIFIVTATGFITFRRKLG